MTHYTTKSSFSNYQNPLFEVMTMWPFLLVIGALPFNAPGQSQNPER